MKIRPFALFLFIAVSIGFVGCASNQVYRLSPEAAASPEAASWDVTAFQLATGEIIRFSKDHPGRVVKGLVIDTGTGKSAARLSDCEILWLRDSAVSAPAVGGVAIALAVLGCVILVFFWARGGGI